MNRKILVAGGSGFIGSNIVGELWKSGKDVAVLCRHPSEARQKLRDIEVDYVKGDVRERLTLARAMKDVDTIIHCVQFPNHPVENPAKGLTYEKIDGEGTANLVYAAKEAGGVKRIIYVSGAGTRPGRPNLDAEPWFRGKLLAEQAIMESGIPYTIFRPSWIYGRDDRSLNRFVGFARTLPFVPVIGTGKNRVQPLFIKDFVRLIIEATEKDSTRDRIYEVGGPEVLTMDQIVRTILKVLGKRKPIVHQPSWAMKLATAPLQLLSAPPLTPGAIDFITMEELVDNRQVLSDFEVELTPLDRALATYVTDSRQQA